MILTYRGIRYQNHTTAIISQRTKVKAKYRGQSYQIPQPQMIASSPKKIKKLVYRGIPYD
ncbi:MAG: DUF4278 domain-containing protein, partial [Halothece sp.]